MRYVVDHDFHIHTRLSICSSDQEQCPQSVIKEAQEAGYKKVVLTDHYWDKGVASNTRDEFYDIQDYEHLCKALPLPKIEGVEFLFGCETDMDKENVIGIPKERYDDFALILVPITHLHMHAADVTNFDPEYRAKLWVERLECVLNADLPFYKVGIPHLTCGLTNRSTEENWRKTFDFILKEDLHRLFTKAASLGVGIELNRDDIKRILNTDVKYFDVYKIAKECGCKFYMGSDAHSRGVSKNAREYFEKAIDYIGLEESDKFIIKKD